MKQQHLLILAALAGVLMLSKSSSSPRGIRNHNPGNIEDNGIPWKGYRGNDGRFIIFDAPQWGIRALYRVLMTYRHKHQIHTVRGIINRWAPSHENNTEAYIHHVASRLGVSPDAPLGLGHYPLLLKTIIKHENGMQPYDDDLITQAIALA
ncbi:structural protein [Grimontia sp. NTOU-MAR1]|uniref:structural protein n=1 Tax=Grimontia sp. NTOU-MAR1 TaxID=3111011 RepID=UPI002DB7A907|nr:structural protein [Grimontia sp. NTOU-MAR1]WRV98257.1 structural protein [Grimontia sp. NTOU-MAR1]